MLETWSSGNEEVGGFSGAGAAAGAATATPPDFQSSLSKPLWRGGVEASCAATSSSAGVSADAQSAGAPQPCSFTTTCNKSGVREAKIEESQQAEEKGFANSSRTRVGARNRVCVCVCVCARAPLSDVHFQPNRNTDSWGFKELEGSTSLRRTVGMVYGGLYCSSVTCSGQPLVSTAA